jgi:AraC-like DNA-binding protein
LVFLIPKVHTRKLHIPAPGITGESATSLIPPLNLCAVAAAFGFSERYTQSLILKYTAKSFFEYIDKKRMKMAYSLLSESSMSVNDIAAKCGFSLPNSFYKSFKRHFGFPPTDLRKPSGMPSSD